MREIKQDVVKTISQVRRLRGVEVCLRVNRGRNKIEMLWGVIEDAYPSIFTLRGGEGELTSFSYSDILSDNVRFVSRR